MRLAYLLLLLACRASESITAGQLVTAASGSQASAPTGKTHPVSGTVFNTVTSQPIGRALVNINGNGAAKVAFTGADGRFQIDNVPEGSIVLSAQRPGYISAGMVPIGGGFQTEYKPQRVGPGSNDFRVGLTPQATLVGKVVDGDGEPVSDLQIQLTAQQISQGRKQWVTRGFASTDDLGEFRFGDQFPGPVVLCTAAKPETPTAAHNALSYPPLCYPNSPDQKSAQPIDLLPGQEMQADFKLRVVPGYTVAGRVLGVPAGVGMGLSLSAENGTQANFMIRIDSATGNFFFRAVPNGLWTLRSMINDQNNGTVEAQQDIAVNGADVQGVELRPQLGIDIPVVAEQAAAGAGQFAPVQLHLISADTEASAGVNRRNEYYSNQLPNANGDNRTPPRLVLQSVQPGQYKVLVQSNGGSECLGTVTQGGSDLLSEPLTVSPGAGAQPIVVSLRSDCASLSATVHGAAPNASVTVLAVPDDAAVDPQPYSTQADAQGSMSFTIPSLRPGNYHVYAVTDTNGLEYMNPDAMRGVPSQTISLDANQKASLNLDLGRSSP